MSWISGLVRSWGWQSPRLVLTVLLLTALTATALVAVPGVSGDGGKKDKTNGPKHKITLAPVHAKRQATKPLQQVKNLRAGAPATSAELAGKHAVDPIDLKLLVISATADDQDLPAIRATLDRIGLPYDVLIASQTPLAKSALWDGQLHGYYQGVILTTGDLGYSPSPGVWESALNEAEWATLWEYEAAFGIRQVTSYTYPYGAPDSYGLSVAGTYYGDPKSQTVPQGRLTDAGKQLFGYLNPGVVVQPTYAWTYLATVVNPSVTTPILTTPEGYALASINRYPDGRENLTLTMANNPDMLHSLLLSYGVVNWVTKGLFLGERHVNLDVQVDDLLIDSDIWDTVALTDTTNLTYRMTGSDLGATINWQNRVRGSSPSTAGLKLEMAFNGEGATDIWNFTDTLTPAIKANQANFNWVGHTFSHVNLDAITYTLALNELQKNQSSAAKTLRLTNYFKDALVQPDISGLYNPEFQRAAKDFGLKYLISDTSRAGWNNPSPNAGFFSSYQPSILIIPRRPSNLFYNVSTPAEWISEYNCYYGPTGTCAGGAWRYWDHDLSYAEILDKESEMWLSYLLKWDLDPLMFHQANLRAYDGTRSVLADLLDTTLAKYNQMYSLPVRNLPEHQVGIRMDNRMDYNASGVRASLVPCTSLTITATKAAVIPVTGVSAGSNRETYGGQSISYLTLGAGQSKTVAVPACR